MSRLLPGRPRPQLPDTAGSEPPAFERSATLLHDPQLLLRRTETSLVRADLAVPGVLSPEQLRRARYLLSLARLGRFAPGVAAGRARAGETPDVDASELVAGLRARVVAELAEPLRRLRDPRARAVLVRELLATFLDDVEATRQRVVDAGLCSAEDLDAEVSGRALCLVLGGGGGAGHVYLGALGLLAENALRPSFVVGTSIGSLYGGLAVRSPDLAVDGLRDFAVGLRVNTVIRAPRATRRHGMPGLFSLGLGTAIGPLLRDGSGRDLRLRDTPVPYEAVVAGVRPSAFAHLPSRYRSAEFAALTGRGPTARLRRGSALAARMWQAGAFFDSRVVKPIMLGGDDLTAGMRVVDAIGFSCAVPGVLHYEAPASERTLLDDVMTDRTIRAIVDGGVSSNVAVELAWRRVQDGRLGTRNAVYLALDCFQPQWDPRHLWLTPITQALQVQMVRNAPFADCIRRFSPTLSVLDLVPTPERFDRAEAWGRASLTPDLPLLTALLRPTPWS